MRRALVLLTLVIFAGTSQAREVWRNDEGFSLTTVGWFNQNLITDWLGVKVKLKIPPNGYAIIDHDGSLELHVPCKGWVKDLGIIVVRGCYPEPDTARDSVNFKQMAITSEYGCDKQDGDVLMIVRIPRMFPTADCRPDSARWAGGSCHVEE